MREVGCSIIIINKKLITIGLDGATWREISPLIEQEKLPNMKHLVEKGTFGIPQSIFPPVTGPAWTSIASEKSPGNTGIFDLFNHTSSDNLNLDALTQNLCGKQVRFGSTYVVLHEKAIPLEVKRFLRYKVAIRRRDGQAVQYGREAGSSDGGCAGCNKSQGNLPPQGSLSQHGLEDIDINVLL